MLENLLIACATGDMTASTQDYEELRRDFIGESARPRCGPGFTRCARRANGLGPAGDNPSRKS
jgi:hypothetical protein